MSGKNRSFKKKTAAAAACILVLALLLGGAYAWSDYSQYADGIFHGHASDSVLLHDDFDGENKDIYAENTGDAPIYVRIRFAEYLQVGNTSVLAARGGGSEKADPDDTDTWPIHTFRAASVEDNACTGEAAGTHSYYTWSMTGAQKSFLSGVTGADGKGHGGLSDEIFENMPVGKDEPIRIGDITTYKLMTESANEPMMMSEWLAKKGNGTLENPGQGRWLLETDGWAYWSVPLEPGQATNLLLDSVSPKNKPSDNWDYRIFAEMQAAAYTEPMPSAETAEFADMMKELAAAAADYAAEHPAAGEAATYTKGYAAWLPFMYIRQLNSDYRSKMWEWTGGAVDTGFVEYAKTAAPDACAYFDSASAVEGAEIQHMAAAMTALMFNTSTVNLSKDDLTGLGIPSFAAGMVAPLQATKIMSEQKYDELAGWAGDLQTFTDYIVKNCKADSSEAYFRAEAASRLGKDGTTFGIDDVYADADAQNLYALIPNSSGAEGVMQAVEKYYNSVGDSSVKNRMELFVGGRTADELKNEAYVYTTQNVTTNIMGISTSWPLYRQMGTTVNDTQAKGIAAGYADYMLAQTVVPEENPFPGYFE